MVKLYHIEDKFTTRQLLDLTLQGFVDGKIGVIGHDTGGLEGLDGVVIPMSGPPDGSLNKGDIVPFGNNCKAEIMDVGTKVNDGHVFYKIVLYTKCKSPG